MRRILCFTFIFAIALGTWAYSLSPDTQTNIEQTFGSFSLNVPHVLGESIDNLPPQKKSIRFVGDVMLARNVETLIDMYGDMYPFSMLPPLSSESYLVGNFEGSIPQTHVQTKDMGFSFSVNPQFITALHTYGFTHLGLANNHSYDFGTLGFENTKRVLAEASTTPFGDPEHLASTTIPVLHVGTSTIALVALYAVNSTPTQKVITDLLQKASSVSDFQVVFIHWGNEYQMQHTHAQEELAQEIIDAGADAIVGHHPHVVEDIGVYKNKLIFYSLGNFVFDQYFDEDVQEGLMLDMAVAGGKLSFDLLPITSIGSRATPRIMARYEKDIFLKDLSVKSDMGLAKMIIASHLSL